MMGSQAPPHPGSFWQECQDVNTGYAYYWNTINNQVVWECPLELIQYRQSLLAVPPPLPPPPSTLTAASNGAGTGKGLVGLVGGYGSDTDDDNEEKAEKENGEAKEKKSGDDDVEKDPEFIGPKIPKLPQEETNDVEMVENGKNVQVDPSNHDLNPPDIQDENSEPPIPGMEDSSMPEEPVKSITEQILSSLPPPPPPLVPAGLASLVSAYSDSDNSEDEDEKPKESSSENFNY